MLATLLVAGNVGQGVGIGVLFVRDEAILVILKAYRFVGLIAHLHGQAISNKVEVVVIGYVAHVVLYLRTGIQQVVDILLDVIERNGVSAGQIGHEGGTPGILSAAAGIGDNGIAVVARTHSLLIGLIGQVQSLVDGHGVVLVPVFPILRSGGDNGTAIGILIGGTLGGNLGSNRTQPFRPARRTIVCVVLGVPVVRASKSTKAAGAVPVILGVGLVKAPGRRRRLRIVHVGDAVTDKDQVLAVSGHGVVPIQHGLTCQQTGMGVGAAGDILLDGCLNTIVLGGQIEEIAIVRNVGYFIKDNHAYLNGGTGADNLVLQVTEHGKRLCLQGRASGLIQHKHHVGNQFLLRGRQRQCHLRGIGPILLLLQVGGRLGLGVSRVIVRQVRVVRLQGDHVMSGFEGKEVMHSGTADSKLLHVGRHTVGVPARTLAVVVPAVDGVGAVRSTVKGPIGADRTEGDGLCAINIITSSYGVVVVNNRIGRQNHRALVPDTAASGIFVNSGGIKRIDPVAYNRQVNSVSKRVGCRRAVASNSYAVVVGNIKNYPRANIRITDQTKPCKKVNGPSAFGITSNIQCRFSNFEGSHIKCLTNMEPRVAVIFTFNFRVADYNGSSG